MNTRTLLVLGLVAMAISMVAGVYKPSCACGLKSGGVNPCTCEQVVVRPPRPVKPPQRDSSLVCHKLSGSPKFQPVGDVCSCGITYVQPAGVNKPYCPVCTHTQHRSQPEHYQPPPTTEQSLSAHYEYTLPTHYSVYDSSLPLSEERTLADEMGPSCTFYADTKPHPQIIPADAVSLSLAYGLSQQSQRAVKEDAISFGPKSVPKDGAIIKKPKNIPEEGLLSFDRQVVELKAPKRVGCSRGALEEEEAEEALLSAHQEELEALQEEEEVGGPAYLTYSDLGYVPEGPKPGPEFIPAHGGLLGYGDDGDLVIPTGTPSYTLQLPPHQPQGAVVITEQDKSEEYYDDRTYDSYRDESADYASGEESSLGGYLEPLHSGDHSVAPTPATYHQLQHSTYPQLQHPTYPQLQHHTYPQLQHHTYPQLQHPTYPQPQLLLAHTPAQHHSGVFLGKLIHSSYH